MSRDAWFGEERGAFAELISRSGCGRTTVLNGLEAPTSDTIIMNGREVSGPALDRAVIFQSPALLPWFTRPSDAAGRKLAELPGGTKLMDEPFQQVRRPNPRYCRTNGFAPCPTPGRPLSRITCDPDETILLPDCVLPMTGEDGHAYS